MYALIIDGKVTETTELDPSGRYHPALNWQPCPAAVLPGWTYDGQSFAAPAPPPPPTLADVEAARLRAYADPLTGSDRHFAEAVRLQAMAAPQAEIDAAKAAGVARYTEIQSANPWPED